MINDTQEKSLLHSSSFFDELYTFTKNWKHFKNDIVSGTVCNCKFHIDPPVFDGFPTHPYGWNLPGCTSLLAKLCHQIMCKADVLLGSFFQRNAQILLSMKGSVPRIWKNIFKKVSWKNRNFRLKICYNSGCKIKYTRCVNARAHV